jgi:hypothetical protein
MKIYLFAFLLFLGGAIFLLSFIADTLTLRHSTIGYLSPVECERNVESA